MLKKTTLFILWAILLSHCCFGQKQQLQFHAIKIPGNFPAAGIRMSIFDYQGLIWYFSNDGLYRYDGNEVLKFDLNTNPSLPSLPLFFIEPDNKGNLWLASDKGVARFDLKKWTLTPLYIRGRPNKPSSQKKNFSVLTNLHNRLYFGTYSGELYVERNDSLYQIAGFDQDIFGIWEPVKGQLWVNLKDGSLININYFGEHYDQPIYYRIEGAGGPGIYNICSDQFGRFLCTNNTGMYYGDFRQLKAQQHLAGFSPGHKPTIGTVTSIIPPTQKIDWIHSPFYIGNNHIAVLSGIGLEPREIFTFDFNHQSWHEVTQNSAYKFPGFVASAIGSGSNRSMISSTKGITEIVFRTSNFISLLNEIEGQNSVRAICKIGSLLYFSSSNNGFATLNEKSGRITSLLHDNQGIYSILQWSKDSILLTREIGGGLHWYLPKTKRYLNIPIIAKQHDIDYDLTTTLYRVNDSLVLMGTYRGIYLINPLNGKNYPIKDSSSTYPLLRNYKTNAVISIKEKTKGKYGSFLAGTTGGVYNINLDEPKVTSFLRDTVAQKIKNITVFSLLQIGNNIWIGTGGRGIQMADATGQVLPSDWLNHRLSGQMIYTLVKHGNKILIGTNHGLDILNLQDSTLQYYELENGLPSQEFNSNACFNDSDAVYLGTINGIVRWEDKIVKEKTPSPTIQIDKLVIVDKNNRKSVYYNFPYWPKDSQHIQIPPKSKYFSLTFGKPGAGNISKQYAYRLHAHDSWISLGLKREITFIHTPPGNYQLQFAIKKADGKFSVISRTIPLTIHPDFFQTIYFKILVCLSIIGILVLIYHYREQEHKKERNVRMKIAGDLHDELGSLLTRIWHQAQNQKQSTEGKPDNKPIRLAERENEEQKQDNKISKMSKDALSMMSDMVWSIDARFDSLQELLLRMKDYVYKLRCEYDLNISFTTNVEAVNKKLNQEKRQNIFLIFKEGINNALKHGDNTSIIIDFREKEEQLILDIINSTHPGNGAFSEMQGGRGLQSMKQRAGKIGGRLKIKCSPNQFLVSLTL